MQRLLAAFDGSDGHAPPATDVTEATVVSSRALWSRRHVEGEIHLSQLFLAPTQPPGRQAHRRRRFRDQEVQRSLSEPLNASTRYPDGGGRRGRAPRRAQARRESSPEPQWRGCLRAPRHRWRRWVELAESTATVLRRQGLCVWPQCGVALGICLPLRRLAARHRTH